MSSRIEAFIKLINISNQKCSKCGTCDSTRLKPSNPQIYIPNAVPEMRKFPSVLGITVLLPGIKIQDAVAKAKESCMGNCKPNVFAGIHYFMLIRYLSCQSIVGSMYKY